jgi:RNA polymerase sigma factor (sigma-70 family)
MTATMTTRAVQSAARLDPRTDSELLTRFLNHHDQAAFATLVQRHGSLVYGVCRRALGASADADDAFQATFLVLVKRAAAIPWRANLGPWLYGVAHRIAAKARFRRDRRFALEKQVDAMPHPETTPVEPDDLSRLFDEELAKLPEEMRRAVVLCELQGLSRKEAAKQLRVSEGTLSSRLGRARKKLAAAFAERGVKLAVPAAVGVSTVLAGSTVKAACDPAGAVPAGVVSLVQEALKAMTISKLKLGAVLASVAVGFSWVAFASDPKPVTPPAVKADPPKTETVPGVVANVNGQPVTRDEFADYLIAKHGREDFDHFVDVKIVERAAEKAKVGVTAVEVDEAAATLGDCVRLWRHWVSRRSKRSEDEWRVDVIRPRLLMEKMFRDNVTASDEELRQAFETEFGERRVCESVQAANVNQPQSAKKIRELIAAGERDVGKIAEGCQGIEIGVSYSSYPHPIGRYPIDPRSRRVAEAVFAAEKLGEFIEVDLTEHPSQVRIEFYKVVEIQPAKEGKSFDVEKDRLGARVFREKMDVAIPKLFEKLKAEAKPVYHLKPAE